MKPQSSRPFALLLTAFIVTGALGVLTPEPAQADQALFRIERKFIGAPFPALVQRTRTVSGMLTPTAGLPTSGNTAAVRVYGGAGVSEVTIEPGTMYAYTTMPSASSTVTTWTKRLPAEVATVATGNPVGGAFTLPRSFVDTATTFTLLSSTAFTGYTSISQVAYANGIGHFRPNNPYGVTMNTRLVFPTTGGNPTPNYGQGSPVTSTTVFSGSFDFSRAGSVLVDPGPNRFGGTMRFLYSPASVYLQYIALGAPNYFRATGTFGCTNMGVVCTENLEQTPGQLTSSGMVTRHLLGNTIFTNTAGTPTFGKTMYRKFASPPASSKAYYLHLEGPWTTGKIAVSNPKSAYGILPTFTGYDTQLGGADLTITNTSTTATPSGVSGTLHYGYNTQKQYLKGVTRVVSLVRPRLTHSYLRDRFGGISNHYSAAREQTMRVFFLPEPGALLMLGAAIAGLAGLSVLRRRR